MFHTREWKSCDEVMSPPKICWIFESFVSFCESSKVQNPPNIIYVLEGLMTHNNHTLIYTKHVETFWPIRFEDPTANPTISALARMLTEEWNEALCGSDWSKCHSGRSDISWRRERWAYWLFCFVLFVENERVTANVCLQFSKNTPLKQGQNPQRHRLAVVQIRLLIIAIIPETSWYNTLLDPEGQAIDPDQIFSLLSSWCSQQILVKGGVVFIPLRVPFAAGDRTYNYMLIAS